MLPTRQSTNGNQATVPMPRGGRGKWVACCRANVTVKNDTPSLLHDMTPHVM